MRSLNVTMAKPPPARWWLVRPAQNLKPATYRCPLCGEHLPALSAHMLMVPEATPPAGATPLGLRAEGPARREAADARGVAARPAAPEANGSLWGRLRARLRGRGSGR